MVGGARGGGFRAVRGLRDWTGTASQLPGTLCLAYHLNRTVYPEESAIEIRTGRRDFCHQAGNTRDQSQSYSEPYSL